MIVMVQKTLRSLMRIALAIVAVLFCAGLASTSRMLAASADLVAVVAEVADAAGDDDVALSESSSVHTPSSAPDEERSNVDTDVDDDDDDDSLSAVSHLSTLAFRVLPLPSTPSHAHLRAHDIDTSRFASGTGLPRGPPV